MAFVRTKGLTFDEALDMPDYEFDALFNDLGDTTLGRIVSVRFRKANGEQLTKEEIALWKDTMFEKTEEEKEQERINKLKAEAEEIKVREALEKMKGRGIIK